MISIKSVEYQRCELAQARSYRRIGTKRKGEGRICKSPRNKKGKAEIGEEEQTFIRSPSVRSWVHIRFSSPARDKQVLVIRRVRDVKFVWGNLDNRACTYSFTGKPSVMLMPPVMFWRRRSMRLRIYRSVGASRGFSESIGLA
jgi:hypothetical protein